MYLPAETKAALDTAREMTRFPIADLVLDAVRAQLGGLRSEYLPAALDPVTVEASFPVPSRARKRRREQLDDARVTQLRFTPTEAASLTAAAAELSLSVSELVSVAVDRHY